MRELVSGEVERVTSCLAGGGTRLAASMKRAMLEVGSKSFLVLKEPFPSIYNMFCWHLAAKSFLHFFDSLV